MKWRYRAFPGNFSPSTSFQHKSQQGQFGIGDAYHELSSFIRMSTSEGNGALAVNQSRYICGDFSLEFLRDFVLSHSVPWSDSRYLKGAPPARIGETGGTLVEAAGQLFHLFRDRLDYAFILRIDRSMSGMRGVLFRTPILSSSQLNRAGDENNLYPES